MERKIRKIKFAKQISIGSAPKYTPLTERERCIDRWPAVRQACYAFIILTSHFGILNCGALFYPGLHELFGYPVSKLCWLMTLQFAISFALAPMYNGLLDKVPTRPATTIAVFITSGAFIVSAFLNNVWTFAVTYTFIGGICLGISLVRVIGVMAEYFSRYRIIALGCCSSSAGFGTIVFATLGSYMIENYSWRMAMVSFGLVHLNVIPLSLLATELPEDPIPEPTVLMPKTPELFESSERKDVQHFGSFVSTSGLASIGQTDQMSYPTNKDVTPIIEAMKINFTKFEQVYSVGIDAINFISNPGDKIINKIKMVSRRFLIELPESRIEQYHKDYFIFPVIYLLTDRYLELKNENFTESGFYISNNEPSISEEMNPYGSSARMRGSKDLRYTRFGGDTLSSTISKVYDEKYTEKLVRNIVNNATERVRQISDEYIAKGVLVNSNPLIALIDQNEYFVNSKLTKFGLDERLCVIGPRGERIPEEADSYDTNDEDQREKQALCLSDDALPTRCDSIRRPRRIHSARYPKHSKYDDADLSEPSTTFMNTATESRAYFDDIIQSSFSVAPRGQSVVGSQVSMRPNQTLSILTVDKPTEATQLVISKLKDGDDDDLEEDETIASKFPLLNPWFSSFLLSRTLTYIADSILYAHFMNFAVSVGVDETRAVNLLGWVGGAGMIARLICGPLGKIFSNFRLRIFVAFSLVCLGIQTIMIPFFPMYQSLVVYGMCYSIFIAPGFAFSNIMAIQIMGTKKMTRNLSYVLTFEALGYLFGGPVGGAFKELRGEYADCFLFSGCSVLLASLIISSHAILSMYCVKRCTQNLCLFLRYGLNKSVCRDDYAFEGEAGGDDNAGFTNEMQFYRDQMIQRVNACAQEEFSLSILSTKNE